MLGRDLSVAHHVELVDVCRFTLRTGFNHPLACIIINVSHGVAVIGDLTNTVFLIPNNCPVGAIPDILPTGLITIRIIRIRTISNQARRMRLVGAVGIGPVIGGALLHNRGAAGTGANMRLVFTGDIVDRVIPHRQRKALRGIPLRDNPRSAGQAIEIIILVGKARRPAQLVGRVDRRRIGLGDNIAHKIIAIRQILEGQTAGITRHQPVKTTRGGCVGIGGLGIIAKLHVNPLAKLIISHFAKVRVVIPRLGAVNLAQ